MVSFIGARERQPPAYGLAAGPRDWTLRLDLAGDPGQRDLPCEDFQRLSRELAGGPGFEPRLTESESAVLPLNYPPKPLQNKALGFIAAISARHRHALRDRGGAVAQQINAMFRGSHLGHLRRLSKQESSGFFRHVNGFSKVAAARL